MKRIPLLFLRTAFALALLSRATASPLLSADAEFDAANALYAQGKFADAAAAYEKLIRSGAASGAVYFNLGNAFYKSGDIGRAVAAYRQAQQVAPRDPDVRANLTLVRTQVQGPSHLPDRWQRLLGHLSLNEWTILTFAGFWITLLLLAAIQLRPGLKSALRALTLLGGAATIVAGACLIALVSARSRELAIVTVPEAIVRNGPFDEFQKVFTANNGAELPVVDQKNGWLQVRADDRRVGWIKRSEVLLAPGGT